MNHYNIAALPVTLPYGFPCQTLARASQRAVRQHQKRTADQGTAMNRRDREQLLEGLVDSALRAGRAILDIYDAGFEVTRKADDSPVTQADGAAEAIILADLARLAPGIPVVAEEEVAAGRIPVIGERFFVVDPLDGTKEFIQRRGDFTVNIALIEQRNPTLGVVSAPARGRLYAGDVTNGTAWSAAIEAGDRLSARQPLAIRKAPAAGLAAVASKSHNTPETDAYLGQFSVADRVSVGSSLKFCLVAAGEADLYPRLAPTCEWDTGAGDAVLRAAGGKVYAPEGGPLLYGKPRFFNTGFVAAGDVTPPPIAPYLKG